MKTPEELALWRRAYVYFDRAHAFARDYILTHGTDVTDYEVGQATTTWINDILYSELKLENGRLHHGVASAVGIGCRVGPADRLSRIRTSLFSTASEEHGAAGFRRRGPHRRLRRRKLPHVHHRGQGG